MSTIDKWRMILGAALVFGLLAMAVLFGLGQVVEQTSFGLTQVITILSTIALGWAQWAFPHAQAFFKGEQESQAEPPEKSNDSTFKPPVP